MTSLAIILDDQAERGLSGLVLGRYAPPPSGLSIYVNYLPDFGMRDFYSPVFI